MNLAGDERLHGLPPPRFGLRALMLLITLLAAGFAASGYLGWHVTAVLFVFLLAILAHVVGNALGTQLRDTGSRRSAERTGAVSAAAGRREVAPSDFAPDSQLRRRSPLGRPITIATLVGALVGGAIGGMIFLRLMRPPIVLSNVLLGFFAAAVLSGIWTFVAGSFVQVAGGAWRHAAQDPNKK